MAVASANTGKEQGGSGISVLKAGLARLQHLTRQHPTQQHPTQQNPMQQHPMRQPSAKAMWVSDTMHMGPLDTDHVTNAYSKKITL